MERSFDAQVQSRLTSANSNKIANLKREYLANFEKEYDNLYTSLFSVAPATVSSIKIDDFVKKYYIDNSYQCHTLLREEGEFGTKRRALELAINQEKRHLKDYTQAVLNFFEQSEVRKNALKKLMLQKLGILINNYRTTKLRVVLSKI